MLRAQTLRQVLVVTGLAFCSLSDGFIFGQMSGMVDALSRKDRDIYLNNEEISWIASTINITCFVGFGIMTVVTEIFGRRKSLTIMTAPVVICWLMVYFAQDKYILIATRVIVGASFGGVIILTYISIAEYVAPNIRSFCLNLMSAVGMSAGTLLGHVFSLILHWRNVALIGLIPTVLSTILPIFWVESPAWLATKGRFEECEAAFRKIRLPNKDSELELKFLIKSQKENYNEASNNNKLLKLLIQKFIMTCKQKYFRRISILMTVIGIYRVAAGRILLNTMIITILQDITGTSDIMFHTLLVDGFSLIGAGISCIFVSKFQMRTLLFTSGPIANIILIILAVCMYIWPSDIHLYVSWIKVSLLALYSILISAGPYAVLETLLSELHPLDIRGSSAFVLGAVFGIIQFLSIKISYGLFTVIGYHGVFLCNAVIVFLCLFFMYFNLPETKGRTLQEIQFYFKNNRYEDLNELFNLSQANEILINTIKVQM